MDLEQAYEQHRQHYKENGINTFDKLTKRQQQAVQKYTKYLTAKVLQKTELRINPNKADKLIKMIGNTKDWIYNGFVDTGRLGCGRCTLGHPLRYEHYAYSPSLRKEIIFGETCVSDFFSINKEGLRRIQDVRKLTVQEIDFVEFICSMNKQEEYEKLKYPHLRKIIKLCTENANNEEVISDLDKHIAEFMRCGLVLTETMIADYKTACSTKYVQQLNQDRVANLFATMRDGRILEEYLYTTDLHTYAGKECQKFARKVLLSEFDTGRLLEWLRAGVQIENAYKSIIDCNVKSIETLCSYGKLKSYRLITENGERIATRDDDQEKVYVVEEYPLGENTYEQMKELAYCCSGNEEWIGKQVRSLIYRIDDACLFAKDAREKIIKLAEIVKNHKEYTDTPENVLQTPSVYGASYYIQTYGTQRKGILDSIGVAYIALDISAKVLSKNISVSDKQRNILLQVYNEILNKPKELSEEEKKAKFILTKVEELKQIKGKETIVKKLEFPCSVAQTVLKFHRASEKQLAILDDGIKKIKKHLTSEYNKDSLFISTPTKKANEPNQKEIDDVFIQDKPKIEQTQTQEYEENKETDSGTDRGTDSWILPKKEYEPENYDTNGAFSINVNLNDFYHRLGTGDISLPKNMYENPNKENEESEKEVEE